MAWSGQAVAAVAGRGLNEWLGSTARSGLALRLLAKLLSALMGSEHGFLNPLGTCLWLCGLVDAPDQEVLLTRG